MTNYTDQRKEAKLKKKQTSTAEIINGSDSACSAAEKCFLYFVHLYESG